MRGRVPVLIAQAFLLVLSSTAAATAGDFAPEHGKLNTGDATPVGAQVVEVELSYSPAWAVKKGWGTFDDSPATRAQVFTLAITWGPTDALDFSATTGYGFVHEAKGGYAGASEDGHGHTDGSLGARLRFFSSKPLELAVTTSGTLPTGSDASLSQVGLSQVYYSWNNTVVATADAGRATSNLELGFSLPIGFTRGQARGVGITNLAFGYQVLEWLQPEAELNFQHGFAVGPDADLLAVTLGVVAPWGDGNRVTAGIQQAVFGHDTPAFTAASVAYKAAF